tara:strand:+ start:332 stop:787 length:456 start_codon:yes stop_codon:yes gene_type:complete
MKKIKLIFLLTIFLAFNNCGYVPLFSNNNYDFSIQNIEIKGDKYLGTKISNKFEIFQNKESNKIFNLEINTNLVKIISSKDTKGNPKTFSIEIVSEVKINNNNVKKIFKFNENATYNNSSSKFKLKKNENKIIENLIEKISIDIINSLQTF